MRKKRPREDKKRQGLGSWFDLPSGSMQGFAQIALNGNTEAVVDGCTGVQGYDESCVRLDLGKLGVRIWGERLELRCVTANGLIVQGTIAGIEFTT